jgi:ribosomal protein L24
MPKSQKLHVKVGDIVTVISGFHKNEIGEIRKIDRKTGKVIVKGINLNLNILNQIQKMKLEKSNNLKLRFIIQM